MLDGASTLSAGKVAPDAKEFASLLGEMVGHCKSMVMEEINHWSKDQLTGKQWNGLIVRWATMLHFMIGQLPIHGTLRMEDEAIKEKKMQDHLTEQVMAYIFYMTKETVFFKNAGCIMVCEAIDCDGIGEDQKVEEEHFQKSREHADVESAAHVKTDSHPTGCLRGGAKGFTEQEDGWVVVQRVKSNNAEKPTKSYYKNVKLNLAGMAAPGSAEEKCASWDSLTSESAESSELEEDEELRGGAGGSSATQRKRQVNEAVAQMENILQGLQTQADASNPDEVDVLIKGFKDLMKSWEEKKPSKDEIKHQISTVMSKLKETVAENEEKTTRKPPSARQSFYAEFHQKALEKVDNKANNQGQKGKSKGKGKGKTKSKEIENLPKFDLRQAFPTMAVNSWVAVMKELEEGRDPSGSVTVCPDLAKVSEIQALSKAHGLTKGILLITKGDTKETDITILGSKKALLPYQGNLALVGAILAMSTGEVPSFEGTTPVKCPALRPFKKENNISLRVMVVKGIITESDDKKMKVDPTYALHLLGCKEKMEELKTSGWSEQTEAYVGYLEIEKEKSSEILQMSGRGGVFISSLRKNVVEWPNVSWRLPERDEPMNLYHMRIYDHAKKLGKPLAFRRGGGASLGIVMPETEDEAREHAWTLTGAPLGWGPVTVREFLEKQGWVILDCTQPKWKTKPWVFRGKCTGQVTTRSFAYEVTDNDVTCYVHITRWEKRRKADEEVTPLPGAKWWSKSRSYEDDEDPIEDTESPKLSLTKTWPDGSVADTVVDVDASATPDGLKDEEMKDAGDNKHKVTGGSPPKKRAKQERKPDIDKVVGGSPGPEANGKKTTVLDTGGQGNCGWRALSFAVASLYNPTASDETLVDNLGTLSKTMQARVTTHLINKRRLWEDTWAQDPKTNEVMENGSVPTSVDEYCEAVKRPQRWVDGLLLATAAVVQKINIVIWSKKGGNWIRIAILKSGQEWRKSPTVPLILSRGHYVTLRRIKTHWPKEWPFEAEDGAEVHCSQGIDTQILELNPLLHRGGTFSTPKNKAKSKMDGTQENAMEADDLLRPCSPCASSSATMSNEQQKKKRRISSSLENDLLRSCSSIGSEHGSSGSSGPRRKKRDIDVENKRIVIVNEKQKEWTCPICQAVLNVAKGDSVDRRIIQRHVQFGHPDVWEENKAENAKHGKSQSNLGLRQLTWPIPFESFEKHEIDLKAAFICPYCEKCLPKIDSKLSQKKRKYLTEMSKKFHLKQCDQAPSGVSLKECHKLFVEKFGNQYFVAYREAKSMNWHHNKLDRALERGHKPFLVDFTNWEKKAMYGNCFMLCSQCRTYMKFNLRSGKTCKGSACNSLSPGLAFWKEAKSRGVFDEMIEKLGLDQPAADKVTSALAAKAGC